MAQCLWFGWVLVRLLVRVRDSLVVMLALGHYVVSVKVLPNMEDPLCVHVCVFNLNLNFLSIFYFYASAFQGQQWV